MSRGEIPYWVYQRDTSNMQSSHYQEITLLTDRIKELEGEIKKLKEENRVLGERVKELQDKLAVQK